MYDMPEPLEYEKTSCACTDCFGDFSGASEYEEWGGR